MPFVSRPAPRSAVRRVTRQPSVYDHVDTHREGFRAALKAAREAALPSRRTLVAGLSQGRTDLLDTDAFLRILAEHVRPLIADIAAQRAAHEAGKIATRVTKAARKKPPVPLDEEDLLALPTTRSPWIVELVGSLLARMVGDLRGTQDAASQRVSNYIDDNRLEAQAAADLLTVVAGLDDQSVGTILRLHDTLTQPDDTALYTLTPRQVGEQLQRRSDNLLDLRADRLAEDQGVKASVAGAVGMWGEAITEGAVDPETDGMQWVTAADDRVDDECVALDGVIVRFGEGFPEGDPPIHVNCRCVTVLADLPAEMRTSAA